MSISGGGGNGDEDCGGGHSVVRRARQCADVTLSESHRQGKSCSRTTLNSEVVLKGEKRRDNKDGEVEK